MLEALLADLIRVEDHQLVALIDWGRVGEMASYPRLRVRYLQGDYHQPFREMVDEADAALLIAPETGGLLEALTAIVEAKGKMVLGSSSVAVKTAGNKASTYQVLKASDIPTPETYPVRHSDDIVPLARHLGYPVVVKPLDGVGCQSVFVARHETGLRQAVVTALRETGQDIQLLQPFVQGVHASVSLLTDGVGGLPLTLNLQEIRGRTRLSYCGGRVPLDHPLRPLAFQRAEEVVAAIPGLKGYVGIDMVLTDRDAVVIEVNPRLTTSYVGVRKVLRQNLGAMILKAATGELPDPGQIEIVGTASFSTRSWRQAAKGRDR